MSAATHDGRCVGCGAESTKGVCDYCHAAVARAGTHKSVCACVDCQTFDRLEALRAALSEAFQ